jgi:hypothetical protein
MATNLPSCLAQFRLWIILYSLLTAVSAQAHPGPEGGHDGDDFVWTYEHAARHPGATLFWLGAGMVLAWGGGKAIQRGRAAFKGGAARSQAAGRLS